MPPHFARRYASLTLGWVFAASAMQGAVPEVFRYINNALGFADRQGNCAVWNQFEQKVQAADGVELPIRFQFNSDPRYAANSCLGRGWWFPLLESTVVQKDEGMVVMNGPGGFPFYLVRDTKNPDKYLTPDWKYEGVQKSGDNFDVTGKDGWKFHYHLGRLRAADTPSGDHLSWNYEKERVTGISSRKKGELLKAIYDPQTGLLNSLAFNGQDDAMSFSYGQMPVVAHTGVGNSIAKLVPTLGGVKNKKGFDGKMVVEPSADLKEMSLAMNYLSEDGKKHAEKYVWDAATHLLLSDQTGSYAIKGPEKQGDHADIQRTLADGGHDSYRYDSSKGIWEHGLPDGTVISKYYIGTPGNNFGQVRKIIRTTTLGDQFLDAERAYSSNGQVLREIGPVEGVRLIRIFDSEGRLQSAKPDDNSLVVRKDTLGTTFYDPFGFPIFSLDDKGELQGRSQDRNWVWEKQETGPTSRSLEPPPLVEMQKESTIGHFSPSELRALSLSVK